MLSLTVGAVAAAQSNPAVPPSESGQQRLRVWLGCEGCDRAALQKALAFVELVDDRATADVEAVVTPPAAGVDAPWTVALQGRGRFADQNRTVPVRAPRDQPTADLARGLKLVLAEYAAATPAGRYLDVTFARPGAAAGESTVKTDQRDPWNYWVYRMSASAYSYGEQSQSNGSYYLSGSANRVTEQWKVRISASRSLNKSTFEIDETLTITSRLTDWSVDTLVVKSLGPKWSFGLTSSVVGSTFSNAKRVAKLTPAVEYDIFPYAESTRRSLTIQYNAGAAHYDYEAETIFGKLSEPIAQHAAIVSLGLRQPWGSAGATFNFTQQLSALERTRLTANGNVSLRLIRSLTLNASGSYSRIRDQFTLEKGDATDDEVLLRQRQLATGYRYSFSVGIGYSFGALGNATVNPRFGG